MLCGGFPEGGADSYRRDSGGPLTLTLNSQDYSVGIVGWGTFICAEPGFPGVYTRTASYVEWIHDVMSRQPPSILPFEFTEPLILNLEAGATAYYSLTLQEQMQDFYLSLSACDSDVVMDFHAGPFPNANNFICSINQSREQNSCGLRSRQQALLALLCTHLAM